MGRPAAANLPVRGRDCLDVPNEEMVSAKGLGNEAGQARRNEESEGRHRPKDCRDPSLRLGRRNGLRMGATKGSLIAN